MCATAPRSQPPLLKHCASHAKVVACEQINVHGRVAAIEKNINFLENEAHSSVNRHLFTESVSWTTMLFTVGLLLAKNINFLGNEAHSSVNKHLFTACFRDLICCSRKGCCYRKNIMKPSIFYQEYEFSCVINNSLAGRTTFDPGLKSWNLRCDKVAVSKCLRFLE